MNVCISVCVHETYLYCMWAMHCTWVVDKVSLGHTSINVDNKRSRYANDSVLLHEKKYTLIFDSYIKRICRMFIYLTWSTVISGAAGMKLETINPQVLEKIAKISSFDPSPLVPSDQSHFRLSANISPMISLWLLLAKPSWNLESIWKDTHRKI